MQQRPPKAFNEDLFGGQCKAFFCSFVPQPFFHPHVSSESRHVWSEVYANLVAARYS